MIKQAIIRLKWLKSSQHNKIMPNPSMLRSAVARLYPENDLFHQHNRDGKFVYRYPQIHYRWDNPKEKSVRNIGDGVIVAFDKGVEALANLFASDIIIKINELGIESYEITCELRKCNLQISDELHEYFFRSPWLPLNSNKYEKFLNKTLEEQQKELNRIARGNILTAAKDLGIKFESTVYTLFQTKKKVTCQYKDIQLQGFTGKLISNVELPEDFAIGAKVSHGFGWIKKIT